MQEYLVAWMNWYYGDGPYSPLIEFGNNMTHDEKMEALSKTEKIKKIAGKRK